MSTSGNREILCKMRVCVSARGMCGIVVCGGRSEIWLNKFSLLFCFLFLFFRFSVPAECRGA